MIFDSNSQAVGAQQNGEHVEETGAVEHGNETGAENGEEEAHYQSGDEDGDDATGGGGAASMMEGSNSLGQGDDAWADEVRRPRLGVACL